MKGSVASLDELAAFWEMSFDMLAVANLDGYLIRTSRSWGSCLGYSSVEMTSRPYLDFVHPDDVARTLAEAEALKNPGHLTVRFENRYRAKDGSYRWLSWNVKSSPDDLHLYAVVHDVTHAHDMAQEKSRFLASMSHELRTPLNSIMGFAQLLQLGPPQPTERQARQIENIYSSGTHLLALISEILDFAKIAAGHTAVDLMAVPLAPLVSKCVETVAPLAEVKGLDLRFEIDSALIATADGLRLHQVLLNLLSNAVKFTPIGGQIDVSGTRVDDRVRISVADSGIGFSEEEGERIFDEFVQLDGGSRRRYEGTGIGLALTRRLVQLMGGTIAVNSQPGVGSVFSVTLPAGKVTA